MKWEELPETPPEQRAAETHYKDGLNHLRWSAETSAEDPPLAAWHQQQAIALFAAARAAAVVFPKWRSS